MHRENPLCFLRALCASVVNKLPNALKKCWRKHFAPLFAETPGGGFLTPHGVAFGLAVAWATPTAGLSRTDAPSRATRTRTRASRRAPEADS